MVVQKINCMHTIDVGFSGVEQLHVYAVNQWGSVAMDGQCTTYFTRQAS
jgi:hypothetical protein